MAGWMHRWVDTTKMNGICIEEEKWWIWIRIDDKYAGRIRWYGKREKAGRKYNSFHWRRLVKNIGWANQTNGGQKVVKSDKCMCVSQLRGALARAASQKSTPMTHSPYL